MKLFIRKIISVCILLPMLLVMILFEGLAWLFGSYEPLFPIAWGRLYGLRINKSER